MMKTALCEACEKIEETEAEDSAEGPLPIGWYSLYVEKGRDAEVLESSTGTVCSPECAASWLRTFD